MWYRWMLTLLFASAILGRTFHCLYVDTQLPGMAVQSRTAELPPLQSPNDFDPNESCCLCKGAIVPPLLTADAAGLTSPLPSPLAVVAAGDPVVVVPAPASAGPMTSICSVRRRLGAGRCALTHLLLI